MKKTDWFVVLDYGSCRIVFPQSRISYSCKSMESLFDIDEFLATFTDIRTSGRKKFYFSAEKADGKCILMAASVLPEIEGIDFSEMKIVTGFLKGFLLKHGVVAFRFSNGAIDFFIDPDIFGTGSAS